MATQCFLRFSPIATYDQCSLGTNLAKLNGTASGWLAPYPLGLTRGSSLTSVNNNTATGPTAGIEVGVPPTPAQWISPPLDADVTISGTITFNVWMSESNMSANVGAQVVIERIDKTGAVVSTVVNSLKNVELAITTRAVNNWTATPTSTAFQKGDRIRIRVAGNDAVSDSTVMASGFTFDLGFAGSSAGADGDSYVTFTETFGFLTTDPTTTTLYLTDTASAVDPGGSGTDTKEMWTARGAGVTTVGVTTAAGWTVPLQWRVSGGASNFIEWFTKPLTAFTLAAPVLVTIRHNTSSAGPSNAASRAELAVCATDGTSPVVWAGTSHPTLIATGSQVVYTYYLAADDLAVTDGQRIRLQVFIDDISTTAMAASQACNLWYAGTSGGASGDTFLTFGQTLTEYVAPVFAHLVMAPHRAP